MSLREFLDAAGEVTLETYGLEVRAAKLQDKDPRYVVSAACLINPRALKEGFSALVTLTEASWDGALQLMQATEGGIEILIRFGKKPEQTGCIVQ
jgi:hypothetical protein